MLPWVGKLFINENKKTSNLRLDVLIFLAEREGFEPSEELLLHMISNHAPSTTRTPLHDVEQG